MILAENPAFERFLPHVRGNVGFVFTSSDLKEIRDIILANKVAAPAKAGAHAPNDVYVPAGNTGMEPGKTSFFQALNIPTKIARGTIEIVSDIHLVVAGTRVGSSEATLLNMLGISPFTYGMKIAQIYDNGQIFEPKVLDIEESTLIEQFLTGIKTIAAISLALNYPTLASVAHSLVNSCSSRPLPCLQRSSPVLTAPPPSRQERHRRRARDRAHLRCDRGAQGQDPEPGQVRVGRPGRRRRPGRGEEGGRRRRRGGGGGLGIRGRIR